jgi:THO complex subunit 2
LEISAGPVLRTFHLEADSPKNKIDNKIAAKRFVGYLKKGGLMSLLLVALAQEVERYPFREEFEEANTPLKVIASNLDKLRSTFAQLLDVLRTFLSVEEFSAMIPDVIELLSVYHVEPSLAFTICRATLSNKVAVARSERKIDREKTGQTPSGSVDDVAMGGTDDTLHANGAASSANNTQPQPSIHNPDVDMKDDEGFFETDDSARPAVSSNSMTSQGFPQNPLIQDVANKLRASMPEAYGDHICLNFFITFWELSPLDVFPALRGGKDVYQKVISSLKGPAFRSRSPGLKQEEKEILHSFENLKVSLREEMHHWFDGIPMVDGRSELLHDTILQDCFLPRILLSYHDAKFGAAMLWMMHDLGVPGFRTMKFLDQLFKQKVLTNIIFMATPDEVTNFATFLQDVLQHLEEWHKAEKDYIKFAQGQNKSLPGFGRAFNADRSPSTFLEYEDFRRLLFKWHSQLFRALEMCFKDREYMHMSNAKEVLLCLKGTFPKVDTMGEGLRQAADTALEQESKVEEAYRRRDVIVFLQSIPGIFKGQKFITAQAFHVRAHVASEIRTTIDASQSRNVPNQAQVSNSANASNTPARNAAPATTTTARLDATAPDFNPPREAT